MTRFVPDNGIMSCCDSDL